MITDCVIKEQSSLSLDQDDDDDDDVGLDCECVLLYFFPLLHFLVS